MSSTPAAESDRVTIRTDERLVLAMLTYRRPEQLRRVLPLLVEQAESIDVPTRILVVDNDPEASARSQVEAWRASGIDYVHEPTPGIAAGRNRALDEAATDATLLVFVDDDETPCEHWLARLVDQWRADRSAAVAGPVRRTFDGPLDPWVQGSGVFERRIRKSGTRLGGAATSNLLLDLRQIRGYDLRFDDRFGISGGSDTMFTHTLVSLGGLITWCDEAEVLDPVPLARLTRRWVMLRTLRTSNGWSRVALLTAASPVARAVERANLTLRALVLAARGASALLIAVLTRDVRRRGAAVCQMASAVGVLGGAYGHVYREYRRAPT